MVVCGSVLCVWTPMETLKEALGGECTNRNIFDHPLPFNLGIHNEVNSNDVFDLRLMPLFLIKHLVIALYPNSPESIAMEEVPNLHFLGELLRFPLPKDGLFPVETIGIACPDPKKFMHDEGSPSPGSLGLNAIPKLMFNWFIHVREAKKRHIA